MPRCSTTTLLMLVGLLAALASGCKEAPAPPGKVNADVSSQPMFVSRAIDRGDTEGDTVILARCRSADEYAQTTEGKWELHWHLVKWNVLAVERGTWSDKEVSFVAAEGRPVPGSGLTLRSAEFPYVSGRVYALQMKATPTLPQVTLLQYRSRLEPYGPLTRPTIAYQTPEGDALAGRVLNAAIEAMIEDGIDDGRASTICEETPECYIVECWVCSGDDREAVAYWVDKKTMVGERMP